MAATPVPRSLLALAFLHLLACTTTAVRSPMDTTTTLPPHASVLPLGPDEPTTTTPTPTGPASSNSLGLQLQPRLLDDDDASVIIARREDNATAPTTTAPTTTPSAARPRVHTTRDGGILQLTPGARGTTTAAPSPSKMATAVLRALPLLAIPVLPPPLAALVALCSLATPVRTFACSDSSDCSASGITHATCTVYRYLPDSGTVDRAQPYADLRDVCPHPLCRAGSDDPHPLSNRGGRRDDDPSFHGYCSVITLVVGVVPATGGPCLCGVRVHLPIADPAAAAAAGDDVCYVEREHMNYREGYYILCPVRDCAHEPFVCCTKLPPDAIAAAVEEHRSLFYRLALGWYDNDTAASAQLEAEVYLYHDEL